MLGGGRIQHSRLRGRRAIIATVYERRHSTAKEQQRDQHPPCPFPEESGGQSEEQRYEGIDGECVGKGTKGGDAASAHLFGLDYLGVRRRACFLGHELSFIRRTIDDWDMRKPTSAAGRELEETTG